MKVPSWPDISFVGVQAFECPDYSTDMRLIKRLRAGQHEQRKQLPQLHHCQAARMSNTFWKWAKVHRHACAGRRKALLMAAGLSALLGSTSALAPSFWWYLLLQSGTGIGVAGVWLLSYTMACEPVGPSWQGHAGIATHLFFACGACAAPLLSYLVRLVQPLMAHPHNHLPPMAASCQPLELSSLYASAAPKTAAPITQAMHVTATSPTGCKGWFLPLQVVWPRFLAIAP